MKFKSLPTFEGKRKELNNFLAKCNIYMDYQTKQTDKDKILFVLYLLEGPLSEWRNTKVAEYNNEPTKWNNYEAFVKELKETWGPVDEPGMALHRLLTYKKLKNTPINSYVARVDQDFSLAGIKDDSIKRNLILLGLPTLMKAKLRYGGVPTTYQEVRKRILDLEVAGVILADDKFTTDPDAMQVDRVHIRELATDWIMNAKCYGCGKTGHLISECPNPKKKGQNSGTYKKGKGKPRKKFRPRNKGKGKGKSRRIRSLGADDESEDDTSDEEEQGTDEESKEDRVQIIRQLIKELPKSARKLLKKKGF